MTLEEFIEKSSKVHNNKFDYSRVDLSKGVKVSIICPAHGEFRQEIYAHLRGHGCQRCAGSARITKEDFIKRGRELHGDKYDYSNVIIVNNNSKLLIVCPEHGKFEQILRIHLGGHGCQICGGSKKLTTALFVEKSNKIHNNKYDYSKTIYNGNDKYVIIGCPEHGFFEQKAGSHHIEGKGCFKCGSNKLTIDEFIKRAMKIHLNKYDYSKVILKNTKEKVIILCPKHKEFEQTPGNHLAGKGCFTCQESKGEKRIASYLRKNKLIFKREHKFLGCKDKRLLPFDFYVPDYNLCIEFDGEQHFSLNSFFGGEQGFNSLKKRDTIKNNFCEDNGIWLLRISYLEFDKIETLIGNKIKEILF